MNPFELPGPQFLVFYLILGAALLGGMTWLRRTWEPDPDQTVQLTDPYEIAYLRGGANEVLRLATTGLIDRSLLKVEGTGLTIARPDLAKTVRNPVEAAILQHFRTGCDIKTMFSASDLQRECIRFEALLQERGLLPNIAARIRQVVTGLVVVGILWLTAFTKIGMAVERRHPFGFLVVLMVVFSVAAGVIALVRRTVRGEHFLRDMQRLFEPLRNRSTSFAAHANTNEAMLMGAVFGTVALPVGSYPFVQTLFPKAKSGGSSCGASCGASIGSTCGSSGDSGSSCGGGGCGGGCGGCGS